jgi:hypothetical protein
MVAQLASITRQRKDTSKNAAFPEKIDGMNLNFEIFISIQGQYNNLAGTSWLQTGAGAVSGVLP